MDWRKVFSLQTWSQDREIIKARQVGCRKAIIVPTSIRPFRMNGQMRDALCESCRPKAAEYILTYDDAAERRDVRIFLIGISIIALLIVGMVAGAYFVSSRTAVKTVQALPLGYPVKLHMLYINEVEIPVKNCAAYYPNATGTCDYLKMIDPSAESFAARTLLGFNANVTDKTYYTSIKVYDDRNIMIGQFVWDPFTTPSTMTIPATTTSTETTSTSYMTTTTISTTISTTTTMTGGYYPSCRGASQVDWSLPLYPTSNSVFVHLQRPLAYDEWIWVRVYYGNALIGEWSSSVA
ncbi:MAG: hypothetical protein WCC94_02910 [Candidatus Bathyarchaeia archaeon]